MSDSAASPAAPGAPETPYVLFELAGATYALPSDDVQQLEMVTTITPVPNAPAFVDGVIPVRGQVVPVVNLRARFGFERQPPDLRSRILVVRTGGRTVGLLVDTSREFARLSTAAIQPPPEGISEMNGRYLVGTIQLGDRLVLVLDVADLFDPSAEPFVPNPASVAAEGSAGETTP